jgi:PAS domain S-box-containing protein
MYYREPRSPTRCDQEIIEQITHLAGVAIERKMTFEELRRSEAYLTEAQRLAHTGSWAWNPVTEQCFHWSEEMFQIFSLDPQQGLPTSETFWPRIHPEDRESMHELLWNSALQKTEYAHDHRILLPDGSVKYIHAIGHPILDEAGELVEFVGTAMDVTERKRAEETLRESETRFRKFVDHAGDAFFVYDLEQKTVVDVNREACDSLGYTRHELIGKTPFSYHLGSYEAEMKSIAERALAGETVFDTRWHRRKDGSVFPVEVHTSPVSYAGRRFLMMVARDISDRLHAEEQRDRLRQLEAELAHMDRVSIVGELAASIAHEVNQPLSGIVSSGSACLRWLAADPPNLQEVREAVRRIVGAGKHAGEVIARIRALTKRTEPPKETLDLNETIRDVLVLVADEAKTHKVIVRMLFADELSPVLGDRVQLQQVVLNLIINAIEAMSSVSERARELVITTRNLDPGQVQVTVEDSGIGIDPNTINKIFDPFYTTKSTGMGMGLSISRSILQHHGGRLWATADHGPGTRFHFALPKYHEEESNAEAA